MSAERVVILGGAGLIGSTLAKHLLAEGKEIIIVDRQQRRLVPHEQFQACNVLDRSRLINLIDQLQPDIVINCINIATITSQDPRKGYSQIINFYLNLYKGLAKLAKPVHFLQMGTTGSGGLGFTIPFTHGDNLEDLPIINKAAFAGIGTSMLTLLSRSFNERVKVSEIKPGLAIFADDISQAKVAGHSLVTLDGGESGHYTMQELALLSSYMGFTTVTRIVEKACLVLKGENKIKAQIEQHDIIAALNATIIAPDSQGKEDRQYYLDKMQSLEGKNPIIATGNLGPPSITRDLLLARVILKKYPIETGRAFFKSLEKEPAVKATLECIRASSKPLARYLQQNCRYDLYEELRSYCQPEITEPWQLVRAKIEDLGRSR